jgi:hypothetical protein
VSKRPPLLMRFFLRHIADRPDGQQSGARSLLSPGLYAPRPSKKNAGAAAVPSSFPSGSGPVGANRARPRPSSARPRPSESSRAGRRRNAPAVAHAAGRRAGWATKKAPIGGGARERRGRRTATRGREAAAAGSTRPRRLVARANANTGKGRT